MFNIKMDNFLSRLINKNKKEQKYLSNLIERINIPEELKEKINSFLKANSYEEIKKFLSSQNLINFELKPEDFELSFNQLKEKIAYELIEALLKDS